jgi:hypothetical protein
VLSEMLQTDLDDLPEPDLRQRLEMRYWARLSLPDRPRPA